MVLFWCFSVWLGGLVLGFFVFFLFSDGVLEVLGASLVAVALFLWLYNKLHAVELTVSLSPWTSPTYFATKVRR